MLTVSRPRVGLPSRVALDGTPLNVVDGTYRVSLAQSFADKIAMGALDYADLSPWMSTFAQSTWVGGYGVSRTEDLEKPEEASATFFESYSCETSDAGLIYNGPKINVENLPWLTTDTQAPVVWLGEFTLSGSTALVCIAGNVVFKRDASSWTRAMSLPATPITEAVGVFNDKLIIGFGSAAQAVYTTNLSTTTGITYGSGSAMYIYAVTAEKSSVYAAGGASTDANVVQSSTTGASFSSPVTCGSSDSKITALAPGGGLTTLYVAKETELGIIDTNGAYRVIVPFDSKLSTNGKLMRYWLADGAGGVRGPLMLYFRKDNALWLYQPSSESSGTVANASPWALPGRRPGRIVGAPTAARGSARFFYYAIKSTGGESFLLKIDSRNGSHHPISSLGTNDCNALSISSVTGKPRLFIGYGKSVAWVFLPLDGDSYLNHTSDPDYTCATPSEFYTSSFDFRFAAEVKVVYTIRIVSNASASAPIDVYMSVDDGAYAYVGSADAPATSIALTGPPSGRSFRLKLVINAKDAKTPTVVRGFAVDGAIAPRRYRQWSFTAALPAGYGDDIGPSYAVNPYTYVGSLIKKSSSGETVTFSDVDGTSWNVRIVSVEANEAGYDASMGPQVALSVTLMETGQSVWTTWTTTLEAPSYAFLASPFLGRAPISGSATKTAVANVSGAKNVTVTVRGDGKAYRRVVAKKVSTGEFTAMTYRTGFHGTTTFVINPRNPSATADGRDITTELDSGSTFWSFTSDDKLEVTVEHLSTKATVSVEGNGVITS